VIEVKDMFLDVGAQQKFDVTRKLGIRLGDPIVPDSSFTILGNDKLYLSKAFDNRAACAVVVSVARQLQKTRHPNTLLAAASVQEEVGLRGAQTLAHEAAPDVCIVCDVGIAMDIPPDGAKKNERLGGGPSIFLMDGSMIPNLRLRDLAVSVAEQKKIPFHLTYMDRGGTDGGRVHLSRGGVPSIVIGPPVRYIHSHNGIMSRVDFDNTVKLISELIKRLDAKTVASLTAR
jgi:endoglucanase